MKNLLLKRAERIEKFNREKALKMLDVIKKQIEICDKESLYPYTLFLDNKSLYFDKCQVAYESLKGYWLESEENIRSYINHCDSISVSLFVAGEESARIALNKNEELINDENDFLVFISK